MKIVKNLLLISILSVFLTNCFKSKWTEKERKDFETKCSQTDTFRNVMVRFIGFENIEFDSIWVKEYKDTVLLNSFRLFVAPAQSPDDHEGKARTATIDRIMNIKHRYLFMLPGKKPYELANMKMIMWAQYTMSSEGWGCVMGDYTLDGERFEHNASPTFIKRDTYVEK